LVARHEIFRTRFVPTYGHEPMQVVDEPWPVPVDLRETDVRDVLNAEAVRPFDPAGGRLLRVVVIRLAPEEHFLLLVMHHIVFDGWSTGVLAGELSELYSAALAGRSAGLPTLPVQYADFAVWQRGRLRGETLETQWTSGALSFAGCNPLSCRRTGRARRSVRPRRGPRLHRFSGDHRRPAGSRRPA
jgi:condensation domain-containing protein